MIDDSPTSISLYERSAASLDVELAVFDSPASSMRHLLDHDADLVFLDILMRERDGMSVLRELRALDRHQSTRVVIVTSKDYFQDRARAKELGATDYLVKPLRSQEIRDIIQQATGAVTKADG
ncbi:MAG: response regulator [Ectothiorhodospiraceae bacterium]|nr:response regulator [Chromatiales bacterium]MCP5156459.1 response regulator [Ectothiorhodospiraceae bacterium]